MASCFARHLVLCVPLAGAGCANSGSSQTVDTLGPADSSMAAHEGGAEPVDAPSGIGVVVDTGAVSPAVDSGNQPVDSGSPLPESGGPPADSGAAKAPEGGGADSGRTDGGACSGSALAIQDDFESAAINPITWQVTDPFGNPLQPGNSQYSVAIDTTRAHSGTHSVKVHNGGLFGTTPPGSAFYGRAWTWLGSSPGNVPTGGHWGSIIGVGPAEGGAPAEVRMGGQFGILIYNYSANDDVVLSDPTFFNDGMDGGTTATVGAWACVEFYFGKDSLRTWINGTEIASLNVTPTTTWAHGMKAPWSPAYASIRLGYANYNANAIDVWYDDVAIDTNRICCP
jgi:hypothetical protein